MQRQIFITLVAISGAGAIMTAHAAVKSKMARASAVIEINSTADWKAALNKPAVKVVKFYSPTCPHCMAAETPYKNFADTHTTNDVVFLAVNTRAQMGLAEKYHINGVPTFLFFDQNGRKIEFEESGFNKANFETVMNNGIRKAGGKASPKQLPAQAKGKQPAKTKTLAVRSK
jgi:thiol-disulfide isomerase/thioredoxin